MNPILFDSRDPFLILGTQIGSLKRLHKTLDLLFATKP